MPVRVKDAADIQTRWDHLYAPRALEVEEMRAIRPWIHMLTDQCGDQLFPEVAENSKQRYVINTDIAAVSETGVALLTGKQPKVTVTPADSSLLNNKTIANQYERVAYGFHSELSRHRPASLQHEAADWSVNTGYIVGRYIMLSPAERGETTVSAPPVLDPRTGTLVPQVQVTDPGRFPIEVTLYDPLDCAWRFGRDGRVVEVVHRCTLTWDEVLEEYPDIEGREGFSAPSTLGSLGGTVEVIDYWDDKNNAITIGGKLYKQPTPHHYPKCPWRIEICRASKIDREGNERPRLEGRALAAPMFDAVRHSSWAASLQASHLDEVALNLMVLKHVDPRPNMSPWWQIGADGKPHFRMAIDLGDGRKIIPTFGAEELDYAKSPEISPVFEQFKAERRRDSQLISFAESMLSGAAQLELSGYAYSQVKQASIARINLYLSAMNRFFSGLYTDIFGLLADRWDIGESSFALQFVASGRGQVINLDRNTLKSIRSVEVEIIPDVPVDREREWNSLFQAQKVGAMSLYQVIDSMGVADDPNEEIERLAFENVAMKVEQIQIELARNYMRRNGLDDSALDQLQQPTSPSPPSLPAAGAQPAQAGAMPVAPQAGPAPGGAMMSPDQGALQPAMQSAMQPGGAPGGFPPQIMQLVQQLKQQDPRLAQVPDEQIAQAVMMKMQQQQGQQGMAA